MIRTGVQITSTDFQSTFCMRKVNSQFISFCKYIKSFHIFHHLVVLASALVLSVISLNYTIYKLAITNDVV